MDNKTELIKELNEFLKGQFMGIHAYEDYIQSVEDKHLKELFQTIQMDHKQHAMKVAERIQNLGGKPVNDVGFIGDVQQFISIMKGVPNTDEGLIKGALKGEGLGIETSEKIVRGDLDRDSRVLIEEILDKDREHLLTLNRYLEEIK